MPAWLNVALARVSAFLRSSERDDDFGQELETHLALLEEDDIRRGMTPEDARRSARVEMGGLIDLRQQNRSFARTLWPGQDPVGRVLLRSGKRRVVGVVGEVRHSALEDGFTGELYLPMRQTSDYALVELVVRTDLAPSALASSVRAALQAIAPDLPANAWRPLQQLVDKAVSPRRFVVLLFGVTATDPVTFAGMAALLAAVAAVAGYLPARRASRVDPVVALRAS